MIDQALLEDNETVIVTLIGTNDTDVTVDNLKNVATVTIADDDTATVSISASDSAAAEGLPANPGQFTITLSEASDKDTIVNYTVTGSAIADTDYTALSGSVVVTAGQKTAIVDVSVLEDSILEADETILVTLSTTDDTDITVDLSNDDATVTITDNDLAVATITANDDTASEPVNPGQFTVTLSNASASDTTFSYSIGGTAIADDDYTALSGIVTVAAGETSAVIDVDVVNDNVLEDDETVIVTLTGIIAGDSGVSIDGANNSSTVTIIDEDIATISISPSDDSADESGDHGRFTITMTEASDKDVTVTYTVTGTAVGGSDYVTLSGTVIVSAGQTTADIDVFAMNDGVLEDDETVIVTLVSTDSSDVSVDPTPGSNNATVTISDNDVATASVIANDPLATEPSDNGQFTVTITAPSDKDTVINYLVTGDATADTDYVALPGTVTIAAGQTSATIDVSVIDNALLEDNETVIVTLTGANDTDVSIGGDNTATVTIADLDKAVASITANDDTASEPTRSGSIYRDIVRSERQGHDRQLHRDR